MTVAVVVHRLDEAGGGEVRDADAGGVAVGVLRQAADEDETHVRLIFGRLHLEGPLAADDVGVHAGAADLLADLVDDEQIGLVERQLGRANRGP